MYASVFFFVHSLMLIPFILTLTRRLRPYMSLLLVTVLVPLYLSGMFRIGGVDIDNYLRVYLNVSASTIVDPGFNTLMYIGNFFGLSFAGFFLALGMLIMLLYARVARGFNVSFGIVLFVLVSHLIIVRDFAQFRVGLAVALALFSYTLPASWKFFGYAFAGTIHLTTMVLICILVYYEYFLHNRVTKARLLFPIVVTAIFGALLGQLAVLDPRIALYMSWDREGYGAAVATWEQPMFIVFLLVSHQHLIHRWRLKLDLINFSLLVGLAIFFAFSNVAIFSFRLTNVAISLYPVSVALIIQRPNPVLEKLGFITLLFVLLASRGNRSEILEAIVTGFEK